MENRELFERLATHAEQEEQHLGIHVPDPFALAPRARPRVMLKRTIGISIFVLLALLGFGAWAAAANAGVTESGAQKTCAAFAVWEKHPAAANIDAMLADTFTMAWSGSSKYVGEDAASLFGDWRGGAKAKYVDNDVKYMREDCADV
jgi:hypothetical protein